eukprot:CAMPEP_0204912842 /NCGR_PEP_ID=MMETSP1397-20131031/10924_1 /ASSEMBLY_ACC=CAM_ASM_000891 /TAXON_ID=49980 /ORGANISM="Climacostomum Climacostomum virens, Strain Stock W-24" /LENGTH=322 /DNA_ID=CAMNT_0052083955 /DNA_START=851 /DNA_END=1819 /DNA_ORIENTATION=+
MKVTVNLGDHFYVFSRFLVSRILTMNKIPPKDSIRIAMDLKKLLVEEEKFELKQAEMESYLFRIMQGYNYGEAYINRYQMMSQFYASRAPLLIVIAGPPVCGKSTLVTRLADRVNVANVLQTSIVTSVMRNMDASLGSRPFWACDKSEHAVRLNLESRIVRKGVHTDLIKCISDGKALIIEGYHIDPMLYFKIDENGKLRVTMPPPETEEDQRLFDQLNSIDQSQAVIVPFLLTISERDHAFVIENWLMSSLPSEVTSELEEIGNFSQQLKHLLDSFQDVQKYLMEYSDLLTAIPINIQHIEDTVSTMHNVILGRIEAGCAS